MSDSLTPEYAAGAHLVYAEGRVLEDRLAAARSKKPAYDSEVMSLRRQLAQKFESMLLLDYTYASSKDVEAKLWKGVTYKAIEDFRKLLRPPTNPPKGEQVAEVQRKIKLVNGHYRNFLTDATGFYLRLILKLLAIHKLENMEKALARTLRTEFVPLSQREKDLLPKVTANVKEQREGAAIAVCRILLYLGDLARYRVQSAGLQNPDYASPQLYYKLASSFSPNLGNPFNQLAVIETYKLDDCSGIYLYLRSFISPRSFPTSRENIQKMLNKLSKRETLDPFAPRDSITSDADWKDEVVKAVASLFWDGHKRPEAFPAISSSLLRNFDVPSTSLLTSSLASFMALLYVAEGFGEHAADLPAATTLSRELPSWLDRVFQHAKNQLARQQQPSVALLDLVDLASRWLLQRSQTRPGSIPPTTAAAFLSLADRISHLDAVTAADSHVDDARDRWAAFLPVGPESRESPEELASRFREPKLADIAKRILRTRGSVQLYAASTPASTQPPPKAIVEVVESSLPSQEDMIIDGSSQLSKPAPAEEIESEGEEVVLFTGRSGSGRFGAARGGSPAGAAPGTSSGGNQSRVIASPIAQVMTVADSPTLSAVGQAPDRMSPKQGVIGSERRPSAPTRSPSLQPVDGPAVGSPSTPKLAAPVPKMPPSVAPELGAGPWQLRDADELRKELLLRDLISPAKEAGGEAPFDAGRAVSPFPSLPPPIGTPPAPRSDPMDIQAAGDALAAAIAAGAHLEDDDAVGMDVVNFLDLDATPKKIKSGALLMDKGPRNPPPGLGGSPAMLSQNFAVPEPTPPPNLLDASSAALLSLFRFEQQQAAQKQMTDQLLWNQERLANLPDYTSPFAGLAQSAPGLYGALAQQQQSTYNPAPGMLGGQVPYNMWPMLQQQAQPQQMIPPVQSAQVSSTQMNQLEALGLNPIQVQMLLSTGWKPPVGNG